MQPASFTQRAIGRAIDMFLVFALTLLAISPFFEKDDEGEYHNSAPAIFIIAVILAVVAYEVIPVHLRGQTAGKIMARTRVVRIDGEGLPTWRQSLTRWVPVVFVLTLGSAFPAAIALAVIAILYLTALADPSGRNVLDKLAGTQVVRAQRPGA